MATKPAPLFNLDLAFACGTKLCELKKPVCWSVNKDGTKVLERQIYSVVLEPGRSGFDAALKGLSRRYHSSTLFASHKAACDVAVKKLQATAKELQNNTRLPDSRK